jgi:hypothetical protein
MPQEGRRYRLVIDYLSLFKRSLVHPQYWILFRWIRLRQTVIEHESILWMHSLTFFILLADGYLYILEMIIASCSFDWLLSSNSLCFQNSLFLLLQNRKINDRRFLCLWLKIRMWLFLLWILSGIPCLVLWFLSFAHFGLLEFSKSVFSH